MASALLISGLGGFALAAQAPPEASSPAARPAPATDEARLLFDRSTRSLRGLRSGLAALLLQGGESGPIVTALAALPAVAPPGGRAPVAVVVEIEGPSLLGSEAPTEIALEVYAYAIAADGSVAGHFAQGLRFDLEAEGPRIFDGGVRMIGRLDLPAGRYTLRSLVYDASTDRTGRREIEVSVAAPPDSSASPSLAGPYRAADGGAWMTIGPPNDPWAAVATGTGLDLPAALPVVAGETATFEALVSGAGNPLTLGARWHDRQGRLVASVPECRILRQRELADGRLALAAELPLAGLSTGAHELELRLDGADGSVAVSRSRVVVVPEGIAVAAWVDLRRLTSQRPPEQAEADDGGRRRSDRAREQRRRRRRANLKLAYAAALARSRSDPTAALDHLVAMEEEALGRLPPEDLGELSEAQVALAGELADRHPEALLPLLSLHRRAFDHYSRVRRFLLASHSRAVVEQLAPLYAEAAASESARRLAARSLALVGAALQEADVRRTGQALLERSLALEPDGSFALLNLAAGLEKVGEYQHAAQRLEELVSQDPKHAEGRVRLAICLARIGRIADSEAHLERLISEDNPDWVLTLAYGELGRLLTAQNRIDEAIRRLRDGIRRLPGQSRLEIQLAYAFDRSGLAAAAQEMLDRALGRPAAADLSPRARYQLWPVAGRDQLERDLREGERIRWPLLAAALDARAATGAPGASR